MRLNQAASYFLREAAISLARSWKVSLLAVVTIAVSLFIGGAFLLVSTNLAQWVERWQDETRVTVYLEPGASPEAIAALRQRMAAPAWVLSIEEVSPEEAVERFQGAFPSLADLVEDWEEDPLPRSISARFDTAAPTAELEGWLADLAADATIDMVDDDRDWLRQLETLVAVVRGIGLTLGLVLLGAAIFTIASVIRLTAYLYRDEISVMRLVGATEFFIRGPFYAEGLLQGLLGGLLAVGGLYGAYRTAAARTADSLLGAMATPEFLGWQALLLLVLLGGAAGLGGAIASLRREKLGSEES
ncbi:MAG: permease-like cell division protein FtsX [Acidobacteriota bacterium]